MTRRAQATPPGRRRGFLVEVATALVLGGIGVGVWFAFFREPRPPNVILISIDTLRADHLGCYGYARDTSPNIDRFAAEGARFATAHSTTSWTLPAHVALLTGLPNELHQVVYDTVALPRDRTLLAEAFRRAGYRTGGFFGGPYLDPRFGFGRGMERYENCGVDAYGALQAADPALRNQILGAAERRSHEDVTAERIEAGVERFLEDRRDEPFFLFVHHWDVHYDYHAPEAFVRKFTTPAMEPFDVSGFPFNEAIHPGMDPARREYLIACYDAEIAWVDHQIGRLHRKLEELDLDDDTIVVITADHGEEFFEHGQKGHRNNLYDETLRIPLIVWGGGVRRGLVVAEPARIFDVFPTVLELAGLPPVDDVYGRSLVPLLEGDAPPELRELPIVAELTFVPKVPDESAPQGWRVADHYDHHFATGQGDRAKLVRADRRAYDFAKPHRFGATVLEAAPLEAYDLRADPGETRNVAEERPELRALLLEIERRVTKSLDDFAQRFSAERTRFDVDADLDRRLHEAGYVGGR